MNIKTYREKMDEVHTPDEIKEAFDESFAICFDISRENMERAHGKRKLFEQLWKVNPDTIITEVDLCVLGVEPIAKRDQFLVINKNGAKEMSEQLVKAIEDSGIVSSVYCFFSEKKAGIKGCYRREFGNDKPSVVKKCNLLIDGDKLLITVRAQTQADRENIKANSKSEEK